MEVARPWEDAEIEGEENDVALRGRLPRQHNADTTTGNTTITISKVVGADNSSSSSSSEGSSSEEPTDNNGTPSNGVRSHGENGDAKPTNGHSGLDDRYNDFLVSEEGPAADETLDLEKDGPKEVEKTEVVNHHQYEVNIGFSAASTSTQTENGKYVVSQSNGTRTELRVVETRSRSVEEEEEEEVVVKEEELDLETLYKRQGQHEFVCPNCRACITKVLVRERALPRPTVRCTSCFSFLTLAGKIFWPDPESDEEDPTDQGEAVPSDRPREPQPDPSSQAVPSKHPRAKKPAIVVKHTPIQRLEDNSEILSDQNTLAAPVVDIPGIGGAVATTTDKPSSNDSNKTTGLKEQVPFRNLPNNSDNIIGVPEQVPSEGPNGKLQDKNHSVGGLFGAFLAVANKPFGGKMGKNVKHVLPVSSFDTTGPELHDPKTPLLSHPDGCTVITKTPTSGIGLVISEELPIHEEEKVPVGSSPSPNIDEETAANETGITLAPPQPVPVPIPEPGSPKSWEILKSIVYGGLAESIASLGIVTSAASGDATTLNIVSLALANLLGGLFIIVHNIWELKDDKSKVKSSLTDEQADRYEEVLGKRENFILHAFLAILSFIIFGLVPPVVYGFTFRQTDDKDLKLAAVAGASLICIALLAVAKAQIQNPHKYFKTVMYYFVIALGVSGVSYLAGEFISQLMEKIKSHEPIPAFSRPHPGMAMAKRSWGSY